MDWTRITSRRVMNCAFVLTISLLVLMASKTIFSHHESRNDQMNQDAASPYQNSLLQDGKAGSNYNTALIFTSAEAEFEWNQFQAPGYDPKNADPDRLIERVHDSERRLLEQWTIKHGSLRGHWNNGYFCVRHQGSEQPRKHIIECIKHNN